MLKITERCAKLPVLAVVPILIFAALTGAIFYKNFTPENDTVHAATIPTGNWVDFASDAWLDTEDVRYENYQAAPGTTADTPWLIRDAAELAQLAKLNQTPDKFAGQYIKVEPDCEDNQIDLSAHYWMPIMFYGYADGPVFEDTVSAHFDGNNVPIIGMYVNSYVKANKIVLSESYGYNPSTGEPEPPEEDWYDYENHNDFTDGGAAGLFGEVYKANIKNVKLIDPVVDLPQPSGICSDWSGFINTGGGMGDLEVNCDNVLNDPNSYASKSKYSSFDAIGAAVGTARYSIVDHMTAVNPTITTGGLPPMQAVGGLMGYAAGFVYTYDGSVVGGNITVAPQPSLADLGRVMGGPNNDGQDCSTEYPCQYGNGAYADYNERLFIGGLLGANYHSAIINGFASPKITYDWTKIRDIPEEELPEDYISINRSGYAASFFTARYIGGLVGYSDDTRGLRVCILNSYATTDINLKLKDGDSESFAEETARFADKTSFNYSLQDGSNLQMFIGGIAGWLSDAAVNNYYAGNLTINGSATPGFYNSYTQGSYLDETYGSMNAELKPLSGDSLPTILNRGLYYQYQKQHSDYVDGRNVFYATNLRADIYIGADFGLVSNNTYDFNTGAMTWGAYDIAGNYFPQDSVWPGVAATYQGTGYISGQLMFTSDPDVENYTASFTSGGELAAKLNEGLAGVGETTIAHVVGYTSDPEIQARIIAFGQSHARTWAVKEGGLAALSLVDETISWPKYCDPIGPTNPNELIVPTAPNTGLRSSSAILISTAVAVAAIFGVIITSKIYVKMTLINGGE